MKIFFALLAFYFLLLPLAAQSGKDTVPLPTHHSSLITHHSTRAVIIGISDYQDPAIPDLRFADRDAEAFAAWLKSAGGGSVPVENIQLLLNEKATLGRVAMALTWLYEQSTEGDLAILYFSGHGDVEKNIFNQPGYLLCCDAPPVVYMSGGALHVNSLQEVVTTLSLGKKARVLVITDACRAGKLAGSATGGAQLTTANLAKQFAGEVKILSCQPNEFSLEGVEWGGGHGAFSYHLVNALYGLADRDADDRVTLKELGRYLEDHVPEETAPQRQNPLLMGDRETRLAMVVPEVLAEAKARISGRQATLLPSDMRGMAAGLLAQADSSIQQLYEAYLAAVDAGNLMAPAGRSANDYYERLIREPSIEQLHGFLKRNFVAALIDEAQLVTNKILKTDPSTYDDFWSRPFVFDHIPGYLARAAGILGKEHFMYNQLKAKQHFFEGKTCRSDKFPGVPPDSVVRMAVRHYEDALRYDSMAAYAHVELGMVLFYKIFDQAGAHLHAQKALAIAPNWVYALYLAATCLDGINPSEGERHLLRAIELDSAYLDAYWELMGNYALQNNQQKRKHYRDLFMQKARAEIDANPDGAPVYYRTQLGILLWGSGRVEEGLAELLEAEKRTRGQDWLVYGFLCNVYYSLGRYDQLAETAKKLRLLAPGNPYGLRWLIAACLNLNNPPDLLELLDQSVPDPQESYQAFDPTNPLGLMSFGEVCQLVGRMEDARQYFQKAFELVPDPKNYLDAFIRGRASLGLGDLEAMQRTIDERLKKFPDDAMVYYVGGCLWSLAKNDQKALDWLEKALGKNTGSLTLSLINGDPDWHNTRESPGFKALMKKYFPENYKD